MNEENLNITDRYEELLRQKKWIDGFNISTTEISDEKTHTITFKVNDEEKCNIIIKDGEQGLQGEPGIQGPKGESGIDGINGKNGEPGKDGETPNILTETVTDGTKVIFEYTDTTKNKEFVINNGVDGQPGENGKSLTFDDLTELQKAELKGDKGDKGEPGKDGTGIRITGSKSSYEEIAAITGAKPGDAYLCNENGKLYIYGSAWPTKEEGVEFRGPKGENGNPGRDGINGDPGEKGNPGFSPEITVDIGSIQEHERTITFKTSTESGEVKPIGSFTISNGINGAPGEPGQTGPEGPQGLQGPEGPRGEKGDNGKDGTAATIEIDDSEFGQHKLIINDATKTEPVEVIIKDGLKGDTGASPKIATSATDVGAIITINNPDGTSSSISLTNGLPGKPFTYDMFTEEQLAKLTGPTGATGEIGPQGEKGDKGDTGEIGPSGSAGKDGETPNVLTEDVDNGTKITFKYTDASKDKNFIITNGINGAPGKDGKSITFDDLTDEQKEELKGEQGNIGPKGDTGETGPEGPEGPQGIPGNDGKDGEPGIDGKTPLINFTVSKKTEGGSQTITMSAECDGEEQCSTSFTVTDGLSPFTDEEISEIKNFIDTRAINNFPMADIDDSLPILKSINGCALSISTFIPTSSIKIEKNKTKVMFYVSQGSFEPTPSGHVCVFIAKLDKTDETFTSNKLKFVACSDNISSSSSIVTITLTNVNEEESNLLTSDIIYIGFYGNVNRDIQIAGRKTKESAVQLLNLKPYKCAKAENVNDQSVSQDRNNCSQTSCYQCMLNKVCNDTSVINSDQSGVSYWFSIMNNITE